MPTEPCNTHNISILDKKITQTDPTLIEYTKKHNTEWLKCKDCNYYYNLNLGYLSLRQRETEIKYCLYKKTIDKEFCFICDELKKGVSSDKIVKDLGEFVLIINDYPYDAVASEHYLLAPKKHIYELEGDALDKIQEVLSAYTKEYIGFLNVRGVRTVYHAHYHLIKPKRDL